MSSHDVSIDPNEATKLLKDILHVGIAHSGADLASTMTANGTMEQNATGHVGGFAGACGENLIDSLFRSSQQQIIQITGNEDDACTKVLAKEVQVFASPLHDGASSSKMKIKNIVDYGWEHKYSVGQLICLHFEGTYVAYAIRAATSPSGAVRVLNHKTGERTLIKGLRGLVRDMAFARSVTRVLLAIVDEYGTLYVYEIHDESGTLTPERLLQVDRPSDTSPSDYHRVVWCAYVPDEGCHATDTDEDASRLLVVTMEEEAEVWNIGTVIKEYGRGSLTVDKVHMGLQRITEHKKPIADAAFAPDGTALATASCDGEVIFFQVYTQEADVTPRCLHRWVPHNNKPLSCLFFLDNLKTCTQDTQFWKYAMTGSENNTELKLWSCESWDCLQTIRFCGPVGDTAQAPALKAKIDLTANYIVLSDINNKVVYILHVHQAPITMQAKVVLLASFPVVLPVLNFAIVEAARCKFKPSTDAEHVEKLENDDSNVERDDDICCADKRVEGALVRLFWMNTKSLQSCHIVYQTPQSPSIASAVSLSTLSQNSLGCTDHLSDLSLDTEEFEKTKRETWKAGGEGDGKKMQVFAGGEVLLTPSDFASPTHSGSVLSTTVQTSQPQPSPLDAGSLALSPSVMTSATEVSSTPLLKSTSPADPLTGLTSIDALVLDISRKSDTTSPVPTSEGIGCMVPEKPLEALPRKLSQRSTASSSSQEVAEILAPSTLLTHDHVGNSTEEEEEELDVAAEYDYAAESNPPEHRKLPLVSKTPECHLPEEAVWPQALDNSQTYPPATSTLEHLNKLSDSSTEGSTATVSWLGNEVCRLQGSLEVQGHQLNSLTEAMEAQARQLQELQCMLQGLPQCVVETLSVAQREASGDEQTALSRVEALFEKLEDSHAVVAEKQTNAVAQTVATMLGTRLDKAIANEFKNSVMPTMTKTMEGVKETTRYEISRRMEAAEAALKDNVSKLVKSKGLTDAVVQAASSAAQVHMQATCREVLQNTLVPTVDRICQNLFLQLNDAFQRGTRDFLHQVELHLEKQNNERGAEMVRRVQQSIDHSMQGLTKSLQESLSPPDLKGAMGSAILSPLQGLQNSLQQNITQQLNSQQEKLQAMVRDEVRAALRESVTTVTGVDGTTGRSQVTTPVPSSDPLMQQQQITLLLRQGHYNAAFQQALTAADLNMVVTTCEMVNPTKLFNRNPCPLQQPVLLSLIQQLCADLATKTDTKLSYLEEAVMNLDKANPVTQEHLGSILQLLSKKLTAFLHSHPTHKLARNAKMLCMATQSLLNS
ncbi:enhancer of mRNA-decapping protein 4-like isoform X2 [Ornithodoros turicata]|uniref:enhancer of mRNA-decapping protein 4-like isoform X2 n=1 Tax=Ornithodoros turicata TaxID=34597 RepID=UPI003139A115